METKNMETAPDIVGLDINRMLYNYSAQLYTSLVLAGWITLFLTLFCYLIVSKLPKEAQSSITSPVNAQETPANGQETPVSLTICTRTPSAEKNLKQGVC